LTVTEAVAASLRRVAGFLCPCSHSALIQAVMEPLSSVASDRPQFLETIENTLEAIVAYGDLLEEFEVAVVERVTRGSLLYAAPPSFVWRDSGSVLLVGIVPDHCSPLPSQLEQRIQYIGHTRRLISESSENLRADLKQLGLVELSMDVWNRKAPPAESSTKHIQRFESMLRPNPGSLIDLKVLNYDRPTSYYVGRWEPLGNQTGRFVARRPQAYGNDLWCYVELRSGRAENLVDLPTLKSNLRGCDEGWRLQAAIDAARGQPQRFKIRSTANQNTRVVDFFSPVPLWAQRRWDAIGEPVPSSGCLFSFKFSANELPQELEFMQEQLWLAPASQ
jgi:hypothetical protein